MAYEEIETVFEDKEVVDFFKSMKTRLAWIKNGERKFVGLLSAIVFKDVQAHFKNQEDPEGPWADWSPSYEAHLKSIGRFKRQRMLQFSGRLRQNFKPTDVRNTGQDLTWFNDAQTQSGFPYAYAHNKGGPQLPQREFMWLSDAAAEDMSKQTLQFMLDEGV